MTSIQSNYAQKLCLVATLFMLAVIFCLPATVRAAPPSQNDPTTQPDSTLTNDAIHLAEIHHLDVATVQAMLEAGIPPDFVSPELAQTFMEEIDSEMRMPQDSESPPIQANTNSSPGFAVSLSNCNSAAFPYVYLSIGVKNDGVTVPGLTKDNFVCTENGIVQTDIFKVNPPETGNSVRLADIVFLIDASGSMGVEIAAVRENANAFANALAASDIDFRLGLVRFGNSSGYGPNPFLFGGGNLTSDVEEFRSYVSQLRADGGFEPGLLALRAAATGFDFRPGSQKVFILISDEDSDDRNLQETINLLQANDVTVHTAVNCSFGTSPADYCSETSVRGATGGIQFSVVGPYDQILDTIAADTAQTYLARYRSSNQTLDGVQRDVSCTVTADIGTGTVSCAYMPGAAPQIELSGKTIEMQKTPLGEGTSPTIEVIVSDDVAPVVQSVTIHYRTTGSATGYISKVMTFSGNNRYAVVLPPVSRPGVDFYIRATDGQLTSNLPSSDPARRPFQIAVLPNEAPNITHSPLKTASPWAGINVSARVNDTTNMVMNVTLYWRYTGDLLYKSLPMQNDAADRYVAHIPGSPAAPLESDIEYYIEATDDLSVSSQFGTTDDPLFVRVVLSLGTAERDIVFIKGIDSTGDCRGANTWLKDYLSSEARNPFVNGLAIGKYLNFAYNSKSVLDPKDPMYTCPLPESAPAVYDEYDTCGGVERAAIDLKDAIDRYADYPVSIIAHSMGGLVAAYMVETNRDWAREHIYSVVTFDSPLKGVSGDAVDFKEWISVCKRNEDDFIELAWPGFGQSLRDLEATSSVVETATGAAKTVPFYPLDAISWVQGWLVVPRESSVLEGSRSLHIATSCEYGYPEPYCTPPQPIQDNHGQAWDRQLDDANRDKAYLAACAITRALDCTVLSGRFNTIQPQNVAETSDEAPSLQFSVNIPEGTVRVRFASVYGGVMRLKLLSPDGVTYGPDALGPVSAYDIGEHSEVYEIQSPASGEWTIIVLAFDLPLGDESVTIATMIMEMAPVSGNANIQPVAHAGGPYEVLVGESLTLNGNFSRDADGQVSLYEWDVDGDQQYDITTDKAFVDFVYPEIGTWQVNLRITDNAGDTSTANATVTVLPYTTFMPLVGR